MLIANIFLIKNNFYIVDDMSSRHPVILGLRNVLKSAASHDITTVTLPLLLTNEMSEVCWTVLRMCYILYRN